MSKNTMHKSDSSFDESQDHSEDVTPILRDTVVELQLAVSSGDAKSLADAIKRVDLSVVDRGNAHEQWCQAGQLALKVKDWHFAQRLATRSLLSYPKYGDAMRLFGDALVGLNRRDEAAACYRFQLPSSIESEYFGHFQCTMTNSKVIDDAQLRCLPSFPGEHYALKTPFQIGSVDVPELKHNKLESAEAFVGSVPDGKLWYDGGNAVVWDKHGRLVEDISLGFHRVVNASVKSRVPVKLDGRICLLGNRSYLNYYHWMCDTLPRLAVLREAGIELDTIDHFILPLPKFDFHRESLKTLGIEEDRLHTIDRGEYIHADEVFVPIFGSNSLGLKQSRWNPLFLNRTFGPKNLPVQTGRRLFISRGTTGKRGICNESELMASLLPLGFELLLCENHSIAEQAEIFASAEAVVGPHGAGLTNIVFCQPGTVVLELFNAHIAPCFWTISELIGLRHSILFCGFIDEATGLPGSSAPLNASAVDVRRNAFEVDIVGTLATLNKQGVS